MWCHSFRPFPIVNLFKKTGVLTLVWNDCTKSIRLTGFRWALTTYSFYLCTFSLICHTSFECRFFKLDSVTTHAFTTFIGLLLTNTPLVSLTRRIFVEYSLLRFNCFKYVLVIFLRFDTHDTAPFVFCFELMFIHFCF